MYKILNDCVVLERSIIHNFLLSVKDLPHSHDSRLFWVSCSCLY